ncbi:hypothetical protein [Prauserella flavalba]|uniref:hypothetical protein n=1 Tax=Prauserella flavalba TaxID=1477506 RepID=UPI0036E7FABD
MADEDRGQCANESDADLEQRLGTCDALYALWAPHGRPIAVSLDDSSIITANAETRSRLIQVHSVIHAMLRGEHADAMRRLADMSSLMTVFTALRSLTLASELLWKATISTWQEVLANARKQLPAMAPGLPSAEGTDAEVLMGADAIYHSIWSNLTGDKRERILDCIAGAASALPQRAKLGLGGFGAAVFASALQQTSGRSPDALAEEHAALLMAMTRSQAVTHRDGRLHIDG